jgi:hypothetical protein
MTTEQHHSPDPLQEACFHLQLLRAGDDERSKDQDHPGLPQSISMLA